MSMILTIFYHNSVCIGAVAGTVEQEYLHIQMIEVVEKFRGRGYGHAIIRLLQQENDHISAVAIDTSENLFSACGFIGQQGGIWTWDR